MGVETIMLRKAIKDLRLKASEGALTENDVNELIAITERQSKLIEKQSEMIALLDHKLALTMDCLSPEDMAAIFPPQDDDQG